MGGRGGGEGKGNVLASQLGTDARKKKKKNMREGTFFKLGSVQRCHRLGSEKWPFSEKRVSFLKSDK